VPNNSRQRRSGIPLQRLLEVDIFFATNMNPLEYQRVGFDRAPARQDDERVSIPIHRESRPRYASDQI
jgi:hypothetical protein